ncbi:MAG: DUF4349 domain-containing protein [Eubacteriales bacterium]|nr:DUF4349 domain-containing protein [Eubacteriales bacterium]
MEKHTESDTLDRALTDLYRCEDIPEGCRADWRAAVKREERQSMQTHRKSKPFLRVALPLAAALVLVIGALSAGNLIPTIVSSSPSPVPAPKTQTSYGTGDYVTNAVLYENDMAAAPATGSESARNTLYSSAGSTATDTLSEDMGSDGSVTSSTKIVRTADLTIASTDYDADTQALTKLTESLGGYVASISLNGEASERKDRVAYYSLRIPSDQLDAFLNGLGSIGRITGRYETATDMTTQYSDSQMRLTTQQDKMKRLRELIVQAADVSDLLEIENEIANTQYQIDSLESSLLTIDRDVDNSQVSVSIQEQSSGDTAQTVELTLWQRLQSGFAASIEGLGRFTQNLLVFLAMLLPVLVPIALILLVVKLALRARRRARRKVLQSSSEPPATAEDDAAKENQSHN